MSLQALASTVLAVRLPLAETPRISYTQVIARGKRFRMGDHFPRQNSIHHHMLSSSSQFSGMKQPEIGLWEVCDFDQRFGYWQDNLLGLDQATVDLHKRGPRFTGHRRLGSRRPWALRRNVFVCHSPLFTCLAFLRKRFLGFV